MRRHVQDALRFIDYEIIAHHPARDKFWLTRRLQRLWVDANAMDRLLNSRRVVHVLVLGGELDAVDAGTIGQEIEIASHAFVFKPNTRPDLVIVDVDAPDQVRPRVGEQEDGGREGDTAVQPAGLGRKGQHRDGFRWLGEREKAHVQAVQDGVVAFEHVAARDVEDVGLGLDDAHGVLVKFMQQYQKGRSSGGKLVFWSGSRR